MARLPGLLIRANQADGIDNARINAGEAWIIYGAADMIATYGSEIDLRTPPASATRLIGADYDDLFGSTVTGGDLDGDGIDDAIVSAALWRGSAGWAGCPLAAGMAPGNNRYNAGETFVIFGGPDLRGQDARHGAALIDADAPRPRPADHDPVWSRSQRPAGRGDRGRGHQRRRPERPGARLAGHGWAGQSPGGSG
jgi:hypothetical protein